MADYIFKVKNGLQVNTNLIYAIGGQIGINTATPVANLDVVGTANVSGNLAIGGNLIVTGNTTHNANITISATSALIANSTAGANNQVLTTNASAIFWSNGAFGSNTHIQFNDSTWTNGSSGFTFSKAGNLVTIANSILYGVGYGTTGVSGSTVNTTFIGVGNSSVNAYSNSSALVINNNLIANSTGANNSFYFGSQLPAYYTNATNISTGTLPAAQLSGSYTSVTGVGALAAGSLTTGFTAVGIAQGGTGQSTQQTALNALAGGQTSGSYLRGNGTNIVLSGLQAADVNTAINSAAITISSLVANSGATTPPINAGITTGTVTAIYGYSNTGYAIQGLSNQGGGIYGSSNTSYGVYGIANTSGNGGQFVANSGIGIVVTSTSGTVATFSNGTTTFAGIYANGNIGISNTSPVDKLSVNGNQYRSGRLTEGMPQNFPTTSGTITVDLSTGNYFAYVLNGAATFAFSNPPLTGTVQTFTIVCKQDSTGSRSITWPASVKWSYTQTPVTTTTANYSDVFTLMTVNGGTTYAGAYSMANTAAF